ncbi:restriction modification system DNA specificity domain protein [Scytonema sp. HK-05]|uniref:restriction endonuclease subunit S n=1 Tax=Scytonema sp. HK-05 TaxID=1137095 RepID=UPI000936A11F|nr:restriction endonuclease subunit S [Scytonema sp. HK-05]OKH59018.1 hypothetical protein NIES2130_10665 [Scytonema sp. HK-05]BAY48818.1 restriction modification system DNA specificity domain protein [Scytonema sp. HK-05]
MREGWRTSSFEEVVKFIDYRGKTPQKTEAGLRLITAKNVKMGYLQRNPMEFVDPEIYDTWMTRGIPNKGDVLFTTEAPLGNAAQLDTDEKVVFAQRIIVMQPNREVLDSTFLKYMLLSDLMQERIHEQGTGATVKGIKSQLLKKIQISFPKSLLEQQRIVVILDEAFEGIDRAIANTEKNLANSRELFESYLNAIFTQKGDGWKEKKLGEIGGKVFTGPFGSLLHKSDYVSNGIPIVNPANIENDKIIPNFNKTVSQDIVKRLQAYILKQNDVVVGRRGEIGRCAVVREEQAGWLCGSGSFFIKPFENVDSVFLAHLLRSAVYRNKLESLSTGATMQNLSNQSLSDLVIAMPSLDEQNRITNKIDDLRTETQQLETIYRQKIAALNELKQSILQKAFTGELTADTANQTTKAAQEVNAA